MVLVSIPLIFLLSCSDNNVLTEDTEKIIMGGITPLSGGAAIYGRIDKLVSDMVFDEINSRGGINGRAIEVLWRDTKCDSELAKENASELIADGISIILGDSCSGSTLVAAETTEANEVILFTSISTNRDIKDAGDFVFRVAASDESSGEVLGNYANENYLKVGILTEETAYAHGITERFLEVYSGSSIALNFPSSQSDFKSMIDELNTENVDAIMIMTQAPNKSKSIVQELVDIDWDRGVMGNENLSNDFQMVIDYADYYATWNCVIANFVPPQSIALDDFIAEYEFQYGEELTQLGYAATVVDRNYILAQVLEEVVDEYNTKAIRDALYAIDNFEGLSGNLSFDVFGEVNLVHSLLIFNGEQFVPVED
jgi:branched-chain amino acid transport system substrate-binding protein